MSLPSKPCHNCRRLRLKCDRSFPQCHKCANAGHECLGYQALFIWTRGVASRGKMSGVTFEDLKQQQVKQARPKPEASSFTSNSRNLNVAVLAIPSVADDCLKSVSIPSLNHSYKRLRVGREVPFEEDIKLSLGRHLTDPFFQDLNQDARFYISYFNNIVCKDLVIYDVPRQNPFRDLIPLTTQHAVLLNIIVANSALHLSNASQQSAVRASSISLQPRTTTRMISQPLISSTRQSCGWYQDSLTAKQCALRLLNSALDNVHSTGIDVALGSVLLFVEFELADSGIKDWRLHMHGARALINSIKEFYKLQDSNMSSLRRCLISNCLVYDVLGSTLARSRPSESPPCSSVIVRSSLQYAEVNNYLSFPAILLERVLLTAQLSQTIQDSSPAKSMTRSQEHQMLSLLHAAQHFDARDWVSTLQNISPQCDLETRFHLASAHQAAVCIYISRVLLSLSPTAEIHDNLEPLVSDIINHLSFVTSDSELFKATSWPTFVAGADTKDLGQQAWAMKRLHELWERLPCTMGYIRSAMEILRGLWNKRDAARCDITHTIDWIQELKVSEIDCMIA